MATIAMDSTDGVGVADTPSAQVVWEISDAVSIAETLSLQQVWDLYERLAVEDTPVGQMLYEMQSLDSLSLAERLAYGLHLLSSESLSLSEDLSGVLHKISLVVELLRASDQVSASMDYSALLVDMVGVRDLAEQAIGMNSTEAVGVSDQLHGFLKYAMEAVDALATADSGENLLTILMESSEAVAVADTLDVSMVWAMLCSETVSFVTRLRLGDEEFHAWVVNTDNLGATSYTNFPFNSMMEHEGKALGVTETGLYELVGDTDDGAAIDWRIRTGFSGLGSENMKRVPRAYLTYTADGRFLFFTRIIREGRIKENWYEVTARDMSAPLDRRVKLAKGRTVTAVRWQFELRSVDAGCGFSLKGLRLLRVVLNRPI